MKRLFSGSHAVLKHGALWLVAGVGQEANASSAFVLDAREFTPDRELLATTAISRENIRSTSNPDLR